MVRTPDDEFPETEPASVRLGKSKSEIARELQEAVINTGGRAQASSKSARTSQGLRDVLFEQIDQMRSGTGDPTLALAIANVAKQILNTARVELDFHRVMKAAEGDGEPIQLGNLKLGSDTEDAPSAKRIATAR